MAYTINANAKNVWIRDNENTRDLSIQTDASSVYLDNGRTLEQELGEGSMVSNVATVDSAMSKIIDGTLDGVYESGVMYGRSLVNIKKTVEAITMTGSGQYIGFFLRSTDIIQDLKTDTDYLFVVNVTSNTLEGSTKYSLDFGNTDPNNPNQQTYFTARHYLPYNALGTYKFVLRTKSSFEDAVLVSRNQILPSCTGGSITFSYMIIEYQQGMENWDIPFFTGLCDVKMPILRNVGKNLFDVNMTNFANVTVIPIDGSLIIKKNTNPHYYSRIPIHLKPNTKYTFKCNTYRESDTEAYVKLHLGARPHSDSLEYGGYVVPVGDGTFSKTFTTNSLGELYINGYTTTKGILLSNIQLEESSTATSYEDHKTNILRTPETVTLRSLPNGVRDELNVMTGEYIKRIGEIVLDGTQDMSSDSNGVFIQANDVKRFLNYTDTITCDKLPVLPTYGHLANVENGISGYTNANGYLGQNWLYIRINNSINKDEVKEWLTQNPVTVQYELAEPVTTIVEPSTIPFAYENGHVIVESGFEGQSLLPTLEYSTVVNRTGQVESVAKTIQTQEKQLTMLEQMLIQNIIGLDYNNTVLALNLEINEVM